MVAMSAKKNKNRQNKQNRSEAVSGKVSAGLEKRRFWLNLAGSVLIWALTLAVFFGLALYIPDQYYDVAPWKFTLLIKIGRYTALIMGSFFAVFILLKGMSVRDILDLKPIKWMDISVILFLFIAGISFLFSEYQYTQSKNAYMLPDGAMYGAWGWHIGLLFYAIVVLLYFVTAHFLKFSGKWIYIPVVISGMAVCTWGALNRCGISIFGYDGLKEVRSFLCSLGNMDWVTGYVSVLCPVSIGLYWSMKSRWRYLLILPLVPEYVLTVINGADSAIIAIVAVFAFLAIFSFKYPDRLMRFGELVTLLGLTDLVLSFMYYGNRNVFTFMGYAEAIVIRRPVAFLILFAGLVLFAFGLLADKRKIGYPVFFSRHFGKIIAIVTAGGILSIILLIIVNTLTAGLVPVVGGNKLFYFGDRWGSSRGYIWKITIKQFMHLSPGHKLIGVGPDCLYHSYKKFDDIWRSVRSHYPNARLTAAHNALLTMLVNVGILGTATFGAFLVTSVKACVSVLDEHPELIIAPLCIVMYLFNNIVSFQTISNVPYLFMVIGIAASQLVGIERKARA